MTAKKPQTIYQIKASLNNVRPPIWRRLLVPARIGLDDLHEIMQLVMDWGDEHLHDFSIRGVLYSDPDFDENDELGAEDEHLFRLDQLGLREGSRFIYEYDFGDSWEVTLLVEKILPAESGKTYPVCLTGKRAGTLEDSGGPWGYQMKLDVLADPSHAEYDEIREWMGEDFDPEAFDLEILNAQLAALGLRIKGKKTRPTEPEPNLEGDLAILDGGIDAALDQEQWEKLLTPENEASAQSVALRQDAVTMLTYIKEHKVTGTQTTGNFPLKAVEEIAKQFVHPPELETLFEGKVYRFRSENEVQPVVFVHLLLNITSLLSGGMNMRWRLTPRGEEFIRMGVLSQVWLLFSAWWEKVDWSPYIPFLKERASLPKNFKEAVLELLLALQPGNEVSYPEFADRLAEKTRMSGEVANNEGARLAFQYMTKEIVMDQLSAFGVVLTQDAPLDVRIGFPTIRSVQLTSLGQGLLETLR